MEARKEKITVALVITELEVGGAERCLVNLAAGLDRARFDPLVISLAPRPQRDALLRQLEEAGVDVQFVGVRSARRLITAVRALRKIVGQHRAQIVQSFLFHANVTTALAVGGGQGPKIATGVRVADPRRWRQRVERALAGRVERIVCVSDSVAQYAVAEARFPAEKLVTIPNGIDVQRFASAAPADLSRFGLSPGKKAIVYVGRLDPQKGLDWFFTQAPALFQQLPNHDLLLVGDGPQRGALQKQAAQLGIVERVHFAGWQGDAPAILAAAEMLVLPSRWEGMPNVVLEAMAAGLPVVASDSAGAGQLLGDAADAQIASTRGDEFVRKIAEIAADSALRDRLAGHNQERATAVFSIDGMVAAYAALYEQLAAS